MAACNTARELRLHGRKHHQSVRYDHIALTPTSQSSRRRTWGVVPRGTRSRDPTRRDATAKPGIQCTGEQGPGEKSPVEQARCQQGTRKQCGGQMNQTPDIRAPRSKPPPHGPSSRGIRCHTERSGARGAGSEEQSRGEPMHGGGQRTADLAFGTAETIRAIPLG